MAENDLTALIPDIYEGLDVVSRELTGFIPSVTLSASSERAAKDQIVVVDVEPEGNDGVDIIPAMTIPEPVGQTSEAVKIIITKSRAFAFGFSGEGQKGLNTGPGYINVRANKIAQHVRKLVNEVETDLAGLQSTFSRAYGTPSSTPFSTSGDFTDATQVKKILLDNGSPEFDNQLVMDTSAGAILTGKQASVNIAGTDVIQRQGILLPLAGLDLRQSAQINTQTAGDMALATTNTAGYAVGATVITLATAGTGLVAAGDIIQFAGDTNLYVITSVVFAGADPAAGDTITIAAPGLRIAITTSATAITVTATSVRNMGFNRSALILAARAPARPEEGDQADDFLMITDPKSGLVFEFSMYKGYRKVRYEVALAWGVKNIKPEHTSLLLG